MKRLGLAIACFVLVCSAACTSLATQRKPYATRRDAEAAGRIQAASPVSPTAEPSAVPTTATSAIAARLQITHGPYLQAPLETGMTIVWLTNKNCVSKVEYGTSTGAELTAFSAQHGLIEANTTLHRVRISGLVPGTKYYYRVVSTEILDFGPYKVIFGETVKSEYFSFTTLNGKKESFSFVVLNDRHEKVAPFQLALNSIRWQGIDLVFLNGDMLSHVKNEQQMLKGVVEPCVGSFAKTIPFLYIRGNHDARGYSARMLINYFPTESQRYYYSFNHGRVHFIVLDSGEDKEDSSKEYSGLVDFDRYREEETKWLKKDVQRNDCKKAMFRVAFVHIPPGTKGNGHGAQYVHENWDPLFRVGKVDLLICAHTHRYARKPPQEGKQSYPTVIGDTNTVIRMDVCDGLMNATVTKDDGTVADRFTVEKKRRFWNRLFPKSHTRP